MQKMKNPAGGRGKWEGADGCFIPPYPCRLQAETGVRCADCRYLRRVIQPRYVKAVCSFLGETLFRRARHG